LLVALEKKESEHLAMLRAGQESSLLKAVLDVKKRQIDEANESLAALEKSKEVIQARRDYYQHIVRINANEQENLDQLDAAHDYSMVAQGIAVGASAAHLVPDFNSGTSGTFGSPVLTFSFGGSNVGSGIQAAANVISMIASIHTHEATAASIMGTFDRRWDEWKQQEKLANKELEQIDKQIAAAAIRSAIASLELDNHQRQIDDAATNEEFLRSKYTNEELYGWMVTQISSVFFQSYQIAYDVAKRVERAFQFERGLTTSDYIHFGYWDSRRSGLLAGEQLHLDLKRLELAYLDQNKRDYEISRHLSLMINAPMALISLKESGQCIVDLPEALFDADYPGHFMRRIKSMTLTIPSVTGPYTSINCTLTLLKSSIRLKSTPNGIEGNYGRDVEQDDSRFVDNFSAVESIATSHAQNDSGMFELNFRDDRYLPFEASGVISTWRIEMPRETNAFDFDTISDMILNLNYTARDGGTALQAAARSSLGLKAWSAATTTSSSDGLLRVFSLRHEFPTEWYRFLNPLDMTATNQTLALTLNKDRFSFLLRGKRLTLDGVTLFLKMADDFKYEGGVHPLTIHLGQGNAPAEAQGSFTTAGSPIPDLPFTQIDLTSIDIPASLVLSVLESELPNPQSSSSKTWWQSVRVNSMNHARLKPSAIADIWIVCRYTAS